MNLYLIIVTIVISVMILLASLYVLVYFQAEEDRNTAYAPKVAVVIGLALSALVVLLLPLDVANRASDGGLDMDFLYQFMYMAIFIMAVGVLPFLIFYYEAEDPESIEYQWWTALKYEFVTVAVAATTISIMWVFLGYAEVPVQTYRFNQTLLAMDAACSTADCPSEGEEGTFKVSVTPVVYIMALSAFVGWFLLVLFGGVGFAAIPADLMMAYSQRPQSIDLQEYAKQKMILNERASKLHQIGARLGSDASRARDRKTRTTYNKFKQAVYFLEKDWTKVKVAYKERGGNPLKYMCTMLLGLIAAAVSILWILHIILYVLVQPPASLFLNEWFEKMDDIFPLFGTVSYGIFAFYLLFCVVKGCVKIGLRFFCMQIHPMRIGNTLMNSMMFNTMLILFTSIAIVQFCAISFSNYARLSAADMFFNVQVENTIPFLFFFRNNIFLYAMVVLAFISGVWLAICPRDPRALETDDEDY
mmetsp:Transcript_48649/g.103780  ORF Transcript_48649/g.103780 Transcript_48649/m.103780 type:complete len:474 (-) Transcript_48649:106-1527(-)